MDTAQVQYELSEMLREAGGISPNTQGWSNAIDQLIERGATADAILQRAKIGLTHPYHRKKLLDDGAKHINWHFNELAEPVTPKNVSTGTRGRSVDLNYNGGTRHQRWEVAMHAANPPDRQQWLAQYLSINASSAYDMTECPVCTQEVDRRGQ